MFVWSKMKPMTNTRHVFSWLIWILDSINWPLQQHIQVISQEILYSMSERVFIIHLWKEKLGLQWTEHPYPDASNVFLALQVNCHAIAWCTTKHGTKSKSEMRWQAADYIARQYIPILVGYGGLHSHWLARHRHGLVELSCSSTGRAWR